MDLRSIINTEAGDSSNFIQTSPLTPVKAKPVQFFEGYGCRLEISPSKHFPEGYGAHQTNILPVSTSTFQQNYQNQRPPLPPIQVSTPISLQSPGQSISANSPYRTTPSSTTTQLPFSSTQHSPLSPSQSHQYIATIRQEDNYQHSNSHHIHRKDSFSQSPPLLQSSVNISGAPQPIIQHQRSQSLSFLTPNSEHALKIYSNQNARDQLAKEGAASSIKLQNQPQRPKSNSSLAQQLPGGSLSRSSSTYQYNMSSSPQTQNQLNSSIHPSSDLTPQLVMMGGHDLQGTTLAEQDFIPNKRRREKSKSSSPNSCQSTSQMIKSSPKSAVNETKSPGCKMKEISDKPVQAPAHTHSHISDKSKGPNSKTSRDLTTSSMSVQQTPRRRGRYTEPPIWARSVKTYGNASMTSQSHISHAEKLSVDQTPTNQALQSRAKQNGNAANVIHTRASPVIYNLPSSLGNWEESITGIKPIESITKVVADFLYLHVVTRSDIGELSEKGVQIEIEAKLGELIDKDTNKRYLLPVRSECVLAENPRIGFKSTMTEHQHQKLNEFLNDMVNKTRSNHPGAKPRVKIDYLHRREVDRFYELPTNMLVALPITIKKLLPSHNHAKIRVTYDQTSEKVLSKIIKIRVVSLDIYSGFLGTPDCRISINLEKPIDRELDGLIPNKSPDRIKDRLSYSQSHYQIDLTQVTQNIPVNNMIRTEKEHELEIEISTDTLVDHGRRVSCGQANEFLPLIEGFLNNVRVLSRFVAEVR